MICGTITRWRPLLRWLMEQEWTDELYACAWSLHALHMCVFLFIRLFKLGCCGIFCSLLWSHDWPCQLLIQAHTWLPRWRPVQPGYKHKVPLTISALSRKCVGLLGRDTIPDERGAATVFGSLQNCDHIWGHFCSSVFSLIHLLQLLAAAVCSTWKDHTALSVQRFFYQFTDNAKVQSQIIRVCTYFVILWLQRPEPLVFIDRSAVKFLHSFWHRLVFLSQFLCHVKVQSEIAAADYPRHYFHIEHFCATWFISNATFWIQWRKYRTLNVARKILRVLKSERWISTSCNLLCLRTEFVPFYTQC